MRVVLRLTFGARRDVAKEILEPLGFRVSQRSDLQVLRIPVDEHRYRLLASELKKRGIHFSSTKELEFDADEVQVAELLQVVEDAQWGYPQPEDNYKRESYDLSTACSKCGEGARQVKPFMVKNRPNFGRNDIVAMFWTYELLVTERVRRLVEDAGLTGVEFWPLLKYRRSGRFEHIEGAYQLFFVNELPPMSQNTRFQTIAIARAKRASPCDCGRLGLNLQGEQMRYRREDLEGAMDFNRTHEWLGGGFGTTQWKVVSHRVFELFAKNRIKGIKFQPIVIEE